MPPALGLDIGSKHIRAFVYSPSATNPREGVFVKIYEVERQYVDSVDNDYDKLFKKMKRDATALLKGTVENITVVTPKFFTMKGNLDAAMIANACDTIRLAASGVGWKADFVDHSDACLAALSHEIKAANHQESVTSLIYDVGAMKCTATIVRLQLAGRCQQLLAANTDCFGGFDMDLELLSALQSRFENEYSLDLFKYPSETMKLLGICEETKKLMSFNDAVEIDLKLLFRLRRENYPYSMGVNKVVFDTICGGVYSEALLQVDNALNDSGLKASQIDKIIFIGGSSFIPKMRQLLMRRFPGKTLDESLNPVDFIAHGAALIAHLKANGDKSPSRVMPSPTNVLISDVQVTPTVRKPFGGEVSSTPTRPPNTTYYQLPRMAHEQPVASRVSCAARSSTLTDRFSVPLLEKKACAFGAAKASAVSQPPNTNIVPQESHGLSSRAEGDASKQAAGSEAKPRGLKTVAPSCRLAFRALTELRQTANGGAKISNTKIAIDFNDGKSPVVVVEADNKMVSSNHVIGSTYASTVRFVECDSEGRYWPLREVNVSQGTLLGYHHLMVHVRVETDTGELRTRVCDADKPLTGILDTWTTKRLPSGFFSEH